MTLSILVPLLACILGALLMVIPKVPTVLKDMGRIAFACGLLVFLFGVHGETIHLGGK